MPARPTYEELAERVATLESELDQCRRARTGPAGDGEPLETVRAERDFYKELTESFNDIAYMTDASGVLTFVSPQVSRYGYSPDELIGEPVSRVIHPDDVDAAMSDFRRTMSTGREFPTRFRLLTKDGATVPAEEFGHVIRERGEIVGLSGIVRDISERAEFEETLRASREEERGFRSQLAALQRLTLELSKAAPFDALCRRAVELGRDELPFDRLGLWFLGDEPDTYYGSFGVDPHGRIRDEREEVQRRLSPDSHLRPLLERPGPRAALWNSPPGEDHDKPFEVALAPLWDGRRVIGWVAADNLLTGRAMDERSRELLALYAATLGHLVTQRRAEEALRESEQRYALAERAARIGSWEWDVRTGRGVWSAAMEEIAGLEPGRFGGTLDDLKRHIHPEDLPGMKATFDACARGEGGYDVEYRLVRADGSVRWVRDVGRLVSDAGGHSRVVGACMDITDRKEAEEQVRRMNRELEDRVARRTRELEQANERLHESEERYRAMWEAVPEAAFLYDDAARRIIDANDQFFELYGYGPEDIGKTQSRPYWPVHPDDRQQMREVARELQEQPPPRRYPAHRRLRKDGSSFWGEIVTSDTEVDGRPLKLIITRDVTEQVEAERALRESEERLRTITENSPDLITLLHPDGRILFQNHALTGRSVDELLGTSVYDHVPTTAAKTIRASIDRLLRTGEMQSFEVEYRSPDERMRYFEAHVAPVRRDRRIVALAINSHDITEQRQAAEAVRKSEERYRGVFENAPLAFVMWDHHCRITEWNPHAEQVFGWSRQDVLGQDFFQFIVPPEARPDVEGVVGALLRDELPNSSINENLTRDGDTITCEWHNYVLRDGHGNVTGAMSLGLDITERKEAEEALRESEERYRRVVEDQTELICRFLEDGTLTFVNGAYCRYFGETAAELLGHSVTPLIPEEDRPKDRSHLRSLSREQPVGTVEHRVVRPDGSTGWMQWTNRMLFNEEGEFVEYQAVGRDITEQVEARRRIEYQSLLLENVTDAIAVVTRRRRLAFWN
ncbi:MAG: PAS domain S-box protein, partial [Planctomycetota bacterium]